MSINKQHLLSQTPDYKIVLVMDHLRRIDTIGCYTVSPKQIMKNKNRTYQPKDGEVVTIMNPSHNQIVHSIVMLKGIEGDYLQYYTQKHHGKLYYHGSVEIDGDTIRPATPKEIVSLTQALEKEGKRWNPTNKQIEKIPSKPVARFLAPPHIKLLRLASQFHDKRYGDCIFIPFNENRQAVGCYNGIWVVYEVCKQSFLEIDYHLIPCKIEDLKCGDTMYISEEKYNSLKAHHCNFAKVINDNQIVRIHFDDAVVPVEIEEGMYLYKVIPNNGKT